MGFHHTYGSLTHKKSILENESLQNEQITNNSELSQFQFVGAGYLHNVKVASRKEGIDLFSSRGSLLGFKASSLSSLNDSFPDEMESNDVKINSNEVLKDLLFSSKMNILLLLVPFAIYSRTAGWSASSIFWLNFFAMVPLASLLGDFTEEIASHTNQVIGGLVNATFGNMVEVIVAIQALRKGEIRIVQASMIGSIFSNLLLVLGCCFFFGGLKKKEQKFNSVAAVANVSLLALSSIALVLPTPFANYYNVDNDDVLTISRVAAIFLIIMYIQLLVFQLITHPHIFEDEAEEEKTLPLNVAVICLIMVTIWISVHSELLVASIDQYCDSSGISKTFVGIVILPVVGNAVEHMTAISVAMKDKMDLAMGVAIGSCTQIALFVTPITVIFGWCVGVPMNLNYPHFEIILFMLSVIIVSITLSTPTTNWLLGSLLILTYVMVAIGFWFEKLEPTIHKSKNQT